MGNTNKRLHNRTLEEERKLSTIDCRESLNEEDLDLSTRFQPTVRKRSRERKAKASQSRRGRKGRFQRSFWKVCEGLRWVKIEESVLLTIRSDTLRNARLVYRPFRTR